MSPSFTQLPLWHKLVVCLAALHLSLVVCGAAHVRPQWAHFPGNLIQAYARLSGADYGFAFFAPGVASENRVSFEVKQPSGEVVRDDFQSGSDAVDLRIHSMLIRFQMRQFRDSMARSWAAAMFGRHPEARSVTVVVEQIDLPTMQDYRSGKRPAWGEIYRASFERRPHSPSPPSPTETP